MRKLKPVVIDQLFASRNWDEFKRLVKIKPSIVNQAYFHIDDKVWDNVGNVISVNIARHIYTRIWIQDGRLFSIEIDPQ